MTRVKIAIVILSLLILMSIGSVLMVHYACNRVMTVLEQVQHAADREDTEQLGTLCDAAYERWEDIQWMLMCTVSHEKLTLTDQAFCRLRPLLDTDCDEFEAELSTVYTMLLHIKQGETPYLTNIF
ncbi:MAG: DUF4363 family protein [Ruminococcus sp.]|nr:DUF4363 family protein [Ruminococcus sp.]